METAMKKTLFATTLADLFRERDMEAIYPCIQDLLKNGLILSRFSDSEAKPQRQDITQYMAAWSRHVGLSEEECRSWLIEYCMVMLSPISKTSSSGIRHSTKSNIKYIYKYGIPFSCDHETNPFKAQCKKDCSAYAAVVDKAGRGEDEISKKPVFTPPVDVIEDQFTPVKAIYKDQFETALQLIHDETQKKTPIKKIVRILNEQGLKTKTGRIWTYSTLYSELKKKDDFDQGN